MLTNEIYFLGINIITSLTIIFLLFLLQIILFELAYAFNYKINEEGVFRFLLKKNSNLVRNFIKNYYSPTIFLIFTIYFILDTSCLIYSNYNFENSKLFLNYLHTFPFNYDYGKYFYFLNFQFLCLLFIFTMKLIKITKEHWVKKDNKFLQKNVSVKENKKLSRKENEFNLSKFLNFNSKIRKNSNAYMLFSKEKRAEIIQQKPELKSKVAEVAKLIGNYWKEMTSEEKSNAKSINNIPINSGSGSFKGLIDLKNTLNQICRQENREAPNMKIVFNNIKDNENTKFIFNWLKDETLDKFLSNNIIKNSDTFIKTENDLDSIWTNPYYWRQKQAYEELIAEII